MAGEEPLPQGLESALEHVKSESVPQSFRQITGQVEEHIRSAADASSERGGEAAALITSEVTAELASEVAAEVTAEAAAATSAEIASAVTG